MKYGNNQKDKNIPFKLSLTSRLKAKYLLKVNKLNEDPLTKLVTNYTELEIYLKLNNINLFKNLYLNIKNLNDILYDAEKNIEIEKQYYNDQSLSQYFYLIMLINKNKNIINFTYSFDLIREINNNNKNYNKQLEKIIRAKIILELINNYKEIESNEIIDVKEIEMIQNENKLIIENNLTILKDIGLYYNIKQKIEEIEIDDLYVDIIYSIISNKSIENYQDYKYILDLFDQMNLSQIDISKKIYEKFLNTSFFNDKINQYLILNLKDFSNENKISFYFILINYILKDSIYIYQIPFLIKFRQFIIDNIKSNLDRLLEHIPKKRLPKISFIIEKLSDCAYYKKKFKDYKDKLYDNNKPNNIIHYFSIIKNKNNKLNDKYKKYDYFYQSFIPRSFNTNSISSIYNNINTFNVNTQDIKKENNNENNKTNNANNNENNIENNNENYNENHEIIENNIENCNGNYNENNIENIYENNNNEKNHEIKSKESFTLKTDYYQNETIKKSENAHNSCVIFFKIINYCDNLIEEEKDEIKYIESFLKNIKCYEDTIFKKSYLLKIKENISIESHNSFINGEDKLILYKLSTNFKEEIKTIRGYSFPLEINSFDIMHNKILICPCKKWVQGQKNGIFLLNFHNKEYPYYFEDTENFKVNCICSLYNKDNKKNKKTDFFLVAGFNQKVIIKLYKLLYDDYNYKSITIKFIDNIIIRKNEYFTEIKGPIKYIKQSKLTGEIIIYSNKKIYVFSPPNLSKYLLFEEIEKYYNYYEKDIFEESTLDYNNI